MIVITGGAGMIGSIIAWHLNTKLQRDDMVVVDRMTHESQWQNLVKRQYVQYLDKDQLLPWLEGRTDIEAIIHMGAISATTERDFNKLVESNIHYSQNLWAWCADNKAAFFYASSAATYGDGEHGYDDVSIESLRPLNGYGYSKHFFDQWALRQVSENNAIPAAWAGFKFFNVYGPNEYHKERMASVAFHSFNQFKDTGTVKLFKSHKEGYSDGMQLRDFVYVKDAAAAVVHFLEAALHGEPCTNGIYNIGTGKARAFKDLASSVMASIGKAPNLTFIDMPEDLQGKYQYFTEATATKLRAAGYTQAFLSLEEGVQDYVQNYLMHDDAYC
ncbi:ADP-glyceromanno-heptose 6-epimerase [Methylotenera sp.]|uniref:ADP-glyceromanno-heptose 6-epimerase n=1 Tax=Methylotenera sp. TaxID=2051956 RepID=UPI002731DFE6|nr:ADP-glyceromanno-heptose 6-epimerase [Methylotenera sp.]MDP1522168.1 ADP-glyceromanno-heptose 6-epimerase [Methylotenera sp.]MDP2070962.1 ADP-glyceromanno-heptose 6-epimerase [Methylotenera sp.]MDP3005836.1 ADP-glyceromanno-heptose 6-epimerase [Methylotenera sp.]MDP3818194.1 ADP-glyceromanno-heptose 6-epimerase [Methylotenera sp.]MDZ4212237.1 ADP-glyceromanno-heptose 6-epimerase [Methylotenera sp.]